MNLHLNRATRARLFLSTLQVFDAPDQPITIQDHMAHGYAEAVTSDYVEDAFILSRQIDAHVSGELHASDYSYCTLDVSQMNEAPGTISAALKMAGFRPVEGPRSGHWTDAPGNEPTLKITLPANLFT